MTTQPVGPRRGVPTLAVGIVALEFATAVSRFVASTLLPVISPDLEAEDQLALLVAGTSLGLFVALPLSSSVLRILGTQRTLGIGVAGYVGGLLAAAIATDAVIFGLSQFISGLAGGILAVFGISAAIRHLEDSVRAKVVAASAAMWILPALVGPVATLGLEHLIGWRWTLLVPAPAVLIGRFLVVRAIRGDSRSESVRRHPRRSLLIPLGAAMIIFAGPVWPVAAAGLVTALLGVTAVMPPGTMTLHRGSPSALAAMMLFGAGYFGADSLITLLLTDEFSADLSQSAVVLSAAPVAWGLTSAVSTQFSVRSFERRLPFAGMLLAAVGISALAEASWVMAVAAWGAAGVGVGLAYPRLYVAASTARGSSLSSSELAVAVITAEVFGGLIGQSVGGAVGSSAGFGGLTAAFAVFAVCLFAAAVAATRRDDSAAPR